MPFSIATKLIEKYICWLRNWREAGTSSLYHQLLWKGFCQTLPPPFPCKCSTGPLGVCSYKRPWRSFCQSKGHNHNWKPMLKVFGGSRGSTWRCKWVRGLWRFFRKSLLQIVWHRGPGVFCHLSRGGRDGFHQCRECHPPQTSNRARVHSRFGNRGFTYYRLALIIIMNRLNVR